MSRSGDTINELAIGTEAETITCGPGTTFRKYLIDQPAPKKTMQAVEAVLDITISIDRPAKLVWSKFKDFNLWMNRFGYMWYGLPADNENRYVYLGNSGAANDLQYGADGSKNRYVVRKVIEEQLIYLGSSGKRVGTFWGK